MQGIGAAANAEGSRILSGLGQSEAFKAKGGGSNKRPSDVADRAGHAKALLQTLDALPDIAADARPGIYLDVQGRRGEIMLTGSLNVSDLKLLKAAPGRQEGDQPGRATVFATEKGLKTLRSKIDDFATKKRAGKEDEERRPNNADLVQSIGAIVEAGLRALWRSHDRAFPDDEGPVAWEIWLEKTQADNFIAHAAEYGVAVGSDRLDSLRIRW